MHGKKEKHRLESGLEPFGAVVFSYSRAQAIEDGVLVEVTETAREAGFQWPFAATTEVWALIEQIPREYSHEDIEGRLWDILTTARWSVVRCFKRDDIVFFASSLHHDEGDKVSLKLQIGPGDDGSPVLTLMLPWQD